MSNNGKTRRHEIRDSLNRDLERMNRRETGHQSFWRSLAVLGMVGWPIAICSVGGALVGGILDHRFGTNLRFTFSLLLAGVLIGSFVAWRALRAP